MFPKAYLLIAIVLTATVSFAATYTVTSSADSGPGTLRQAIIDANANPGVDQIRFTTDVLVNAPSSLPNITDAVDIDGLQDIHKSLVVGSGLYDGFRAFHFAAGSSGSTLRNVSVSTFSESVRIDSGVTGVLLERSVVEGLFVFGDDNSIRDNSILGLQIFSDNNEVLGNHVPNVHLMFASGNRIGSATSGNTIVMLDVESSGGTIIEGNAIADVRLRNSNPPALGSRLVGNTITGGVRILTGLAPLSGVEITRNSIIGVQPIDLGGDGPTANDPAPDLDTGANGLQNYPVLTSAIVQTNSVDVAGTLASAPATQYRIELFSNDAGNPAMRTYVGFFSVTTDATGHSSFAGSVSSPAVMPLAGEVMTATATNTGTSDTSEVSASATIVAGPSITSFFPTFGALGDNVTITGSNLAGATAVRFNGTDAPFTVNTATELVATVPVGATTGPLTAATPAGIATNSSTFTVITVRGDVNQDGVVTASDIFTLVDQLFGGEGTTPFADVNGDGAATVADLFFLVNFIFANGPAPSP